jgi:hypothetical protein
MIYVPCDFMGLNLHWADASNIQFLVNQKITAGLANADGESDYRRQRSGERDRRGPGDVVRRRRPR